MSTSQKVFQFIAEAFAEEHGIDLNNLCDSFDKDMATKLVQNTASIPASLIPPAPEYNEGRLVQNGHQIVLSPESTGLDVPVVAHLWRAPAGGYKSTWTKPKMVQVKDSNGNVVKVEDANGNLVDKMEKQDVTYNMTHYGIKLFDSTVRGFYENMANHPDPAVSNSGRQIDLDGVKGTNKGYINCENFSVFERENSTNNSPFVCI